MCTELEQNLIHLERSGKGFDKHGSPDGTMLHANVGLREVEDVIPEARLEIVFHLRQVEVRSASALDELVRVVEEVETKVEQRCRHGCIVDGEARLI